MAANQTSHKNTFRVIDAMDAPFRGRIVRLRFLGGSPPTIKELKGARLQAQSPDGEVESLKVVGFSLAAGRPSDARLSRTGRVDLLVEATAGPETPKVSARWEIIGPE